MTDPTAPADPTTPPIAKASPMQRLTAESVTLGYDRRIIARDLSVEIPDHSFTVVVGPNACGKSTLLRALSRMLKPAEGRVLLDGAAIHSLLGQEGRQDPRSAAAVVRRARRHHRRRPGRPWPLSAPGAAAAVVARRRADRPGVDGGHPYRGSRRSLCRRIVRRAAPAGLDRDGPRPADAAAAPRRTHHLPRHPAPDRGARPLRRTARDRRAHPRRRPARPEPRRPLRHASRRHARRGGRGGGAMRPRWSQRRWWSGCSGCAVRSSRTPRRAPRWWCPRAARPGAGTPCRQSRRSD